MISRLIDTLREAAGLELDAREVAEILWLAPFLDASPARSEPVSSNSPCGEPSGSPLPLDTEPPDVRVEEALSPPPMPGPAAPDLDVVLPQREREQGGPIRSGGGVTFRSPGALALPHALQLGRALRPLRGRLVTSRHRELDEVATAERIAREGLWVPVMRPGRSRWLALELVIDTGRSMAIWSQTLSELRTLLLHHGAFRDVRTWSLVTEGQEGRVRLYRGAMGAAHGAPERDPRELMGMHAERRLILVVSDCVSSGWHTGGVGALLRSWGRSGPVAILQMLPQRVWVRTALRHHPAVWLHGRAPGESNARLVFGPWPGARVASPRGVVPVPAVTLEGESFASWARVVAGRAGAWAPGVLLREGGRAREEPARTPEAVEPLERVRRFDAMASPLAQRLVRLFAAVPLSLPVMRLVWRTRLPEAGQVHLAEVFLGGLLEEVSAPGGPVDPEQVQYDFVAGVRELLLESLPPAESLDILDGISHYIEERLGRTLDFQALLADPTAFDGEQLDDSLRPFARVAAAVFRQWGGEYEALATRLESLPSGRERQGARAREESPRNGPPTREARPGMPAEQPPAAPRWIPSGKRVFVVGTGEAELPEELRRLCGLLGRELARKGHSLLAGRGRPGVDQEVGAAYVTALREMGGAPDLHFIQVAEEWGSAGFLAHADVIVLLRGAVGSFQAFKAAFSSFKPVLPLPGTGGVARNAYQTMLSDDAYRWTSGLSKRGLRRLDVPVSTPEQTERAVDELLRLIERLQPGTEAAPYARAMLELLEAVEPGLFLEGGLAGKPGWHAFRFRFMRAAGLRHIAPLSTARLDWKSKESIASALQALRATLPGMAERLMEDFDELNALEARELHGRRVQAELAPLLLEFAGREALDAMGELISNILRSPAIGDDGAIVSLIKAVWDRFDSLDQFEAWLSSHAGVSSEEFEFKGKFLYVAERLSREYDALRGGGGDEVEAALLEIVRQGGLASLEHAQSPLTPWEYGMGYQATVQGPHRRFTGMHEAANVLDTRIVPPNPRFVRRFLSSDKSSLRATAYLLIQEYGLTRSLLELRDAISLERASLRTRQNGWAFAVNRLFACVLYHHAEFALQEGWSGVQEELSPFFEELRAYAAPGEDLALEQVMARLAEALKRGRPRVEGAQPPDSSMAYARALLMFLVSEQPQLFTRSARADHPKWSAFLEHLSQQAQVSFPPTEGGALLLVRGLMSEGASSQFMTGTPGRTSEAAIARLEAVLPGAAENLIADFERLTDFEVHGLIGHEVLTALALLVARFDGEGCLEIIQRLGSRGPENAERLRTLSLCLDKVGEVLRAQGNSVGASKAFQSSKDIRERLGGSGPENIQRRSAPDVPRIQPEPPEVVSPRLRWEDLSWERLDLSDAAPLDVSVRSEVSKLRDRLIEQNKRGEALHARGDLQGALESYRSSLATAQSLVEDSPWKTEWQRELSFVHDKLGEVLHARGDHQEALESYRSSLAIAQRFFEQAPTSASGIQWNRDFSITANWIGDVLRDQGRLQEALDTYQSALAVRKSLVGLHPRHLELQRDLCVSHNKVGEALRAQGRFPEALTAYRAALAMAKDLVERGPGNTEWKNDLAIVHGNIGEVLRAQGRLQEALEACQSALAIQEKLAELDPRNVEWQRELSLGREKVDVLLRALNQKP